MSKCLISALRGPLLKKKTSCRNWPSCRVPRGTTWKLLAKAPILWLLNVIADAFNVISDQVWQNGAFNFDNLIHLTDSMITLCVILQIKLIIVNSPVFISHLLWRQGFFLSVRCVRAEFLRRLIKCIEAGGGLIQD